MTATAEFRLSIMKALADQLADGLNSLEPDPLDIPHLANVERRPGVYQLYKNRELVYVGKHEQSVARRLVEHHEKIKGRMNIALADMSFTALYVHEDLHSVAPETRLIADYRNRGLAAWNNTGFGRHDPGRNRDTTDIDDKDFDAMYPVNLDWTCNDIRRGTYTASDLLERVSEAVPYKFRYQRELLHHDVAVTVNTDAPTADELFELLGRAIHAADPNWYITALPGYVIMYPRAGPYPSARKQYY